MEETVKCTVEEEKLPAEEEMVEEKTTVEENGQEPGDQIEDREEKKAEDVKPPRGSRYEMISTFGYIGILLLMAIPIVGPILTIIWALGGCRKQQKRSFARAKLILSVLTLILNVFLVFAAVDAVVAVVEDLGEQYGISSIEEATQLVEGVMTGNLSEESQELLGGMLETYIEGSEEVVTDLISSYIGGEVELTAEEKEQVNQVVKGVMNGEITITQDDIDRFLAQMD